MGLKYRCCCCCCYSLKTTAHLPGQFNVGNTHNRVNDEVSGGVNRVPERPPELLLQYNTTPARINCELNLIQFVPKFNYTAKLIMFNKQ